MFRLNYFYLKMADSVTIAILIIVIIILVLMSILFIMFAVILTRLGIVITKVDTILNEILGLINSLNSPAIAEKTVTTSKAKMFKLATPCCGGK